MQTWIKPWEAMPKRWKATKTKLGNTHHPGPVHSLMTAAPSEEIIKGIITCKRKRSYQSGKFISLCDQLHFRNIHYHNPFGSSASKPLIFRDGFKIEKVVLKISTQCTNFCTVHFYKNIYKIFIISPVVRLMDAGMVEWHMQGSIDELINRKIN